MAGFSVVEFLTEQTVEVVPNNWIVGPNACWWPTITGPKFQKLVTNPDSEPDLRNRMGVLYIVKVIKTYKNYADAKRHLLDAEDTSCLETESDDQSKKSRKERKRKMQDEDFIDPCKILSYSQLFESDDRDEDSVSLLADQRKKRKALSDNNNLPSNTPKKQERRSQPVIIKMETDANSTFSTENMDLHTNLNIQNAVDTPVLSKQSRKDFHTQPTNETMLVQILENLEKLSSKLSDLDRKVDNLSSQIERITNSAESGSFVRHIDLLPPELVLPVKTEEDLKQLNEILQKKKDLSVILVRYLHSYGHGKTPNSFMLSICKKILAQEVALLYSRFGKKGKKPFSQFSETMNVIIAAAKSRFKNVEREVLSEMFGKALAGASDWNGRAR